MGTVRCGWFLALTCGIAACVQTHPTEPVPLADVLRKPCSAAKVLWLVGAEGHLVLVEALDSEHAAVRSRALRNLHVADTADRKDAAWYSSMFE